jgi:rSAM/selenodomain-associated transferase 2
MLSVVIPTLNAEARLSDCLERMKGADEILVVDGGSRDSTVAIAESAGVRLVISPPGRGAQLGVGAEAAKGDWLFFLHADTLPGAGWCSAVDSHRASQPAQAACFRFRLADRSWQARVLERAVALRVRLFGLAYGDQGLLISRELYREIGGYRALPLMEDIDLVRRLGRRRLRLLDEGAWTSAERWRRDGWFRRSLRNLSCLLLYRLGVSPAKIAALYG